jgi:Xaa-Pro aminopeptidase
MLTAEGCRLRRERLLDRLNPVDPILLADPTHLRYFANFHVEAISQHSDFGGFLVIQPNGSTTLIHDNRLPKTVELAHVDERIPVLWYNGQVPGRDPRRLLPRPHIEAHGGRIHDAITDPLAPQLFAHTGELMRRKDPDEIALLKLCMRATDAGHAWARANIRAGMTELELYHGVAAACQNFLGQWAIVYGDFVVGSSTRRVGPPTTRVLKNGDTFILDFSVIVQGYRSDFTNTLVVGGQPTPEQERLFGLCVKALEAGERELKAGAKCKTVYDAVRGVFEAAGTAECFTSHAGHGLGAMHPEAPYIVMHATETLVAGDVVTLEPGQYIGDIGIRIEHNYLITDTGYERLSNHAITMV